MQRIQVERLRDAQNIAKKQKGKCLSEEYINSKLKLSWECSKGHIWEAPFDQIKGTKSRKGTWCPYCANKIISKDELSLCVIGRNIEPVSKKYLLSSTKYKWKCLVCNLIWEATHNNIKRGKGCPDCAQIKRNETQTKYSIEDLKKSAHKKKGDCLNKTYLGYHKKHKFKCENNHEWLSVASTILRDKSWCPYCAGQGVAMIIQLFGVIAIFMGSVGIEV